MDQTEDIFYLQRIAEGDSNALADFYDRYCRLVYSVAFQVLGDAQQAEEVVQDVYIQVWNKADTYDPSQGKVTTWITSITRHRAIDHYRRIDVRAEGHSVSWDDCCTESPDDDGQIEPDMIHSEQRRMVIQALSELPADQKAAIALVYFRGMTQQEIASHLNEPLGTIKTRIRLGLQKLRASFTTITDGSK
jgi:RNA polymerase sigma-70 factor, ECF subfamily